MERLKIAVDFDGTCVTHEYPEVGKDIGAVPVLRRIAERHDIILLTMRDGLHLADAIEWFERHGIALWSSNRNPEQQTWTKSPKVYANLYIDDAALGIPLKRVGEKRAFVDWEQVALLLERQGVI